MAGSAATVIKRRLYDPENRAETYLRFYYEISWTADDSDGSVPNAAIPETTGYVVLAITDPGATAPTANYDITIEDEFGVDIMGGALTDRSATLTEQAMPLIAVTPVPRMVNGALTFKLANNSVNSAVGKCYVYIQK